MEEEDDFEKVEDTMNCKVVLIKRWNVNLAHAHKLELHGFSDLSLQA